MSEGSACWSGIRQWLISSSVLQLTVELNPGAPSTTLGSDLLHVRAVGNNDTLHFLFSSQGAPTLLLVHTNTSSSTVKVCGNTML